LGLKSDGTLWAWGRNNYGQLGDGTTMDKFYPFIVNNPPNALAGGPYTGTEGQSIALDGSGSGDPESNIVTYEWDIDNDGTYEYNSSSPFQSHTYVQDGTYTINLRVTDSRGEQDLATTTATIDNNPPTADFTGTPTSGDAPLTVNFTNNSSGGNPPLSYEWDFDNNGSVDSTLTDPSQLYSGQGTYSVKLAATDFDSDTNTLTRTNYITVCYSLVNIVDDSAPYSSLQTAYNAASHLDTIQSRTASFSGGLNINRNITVTMEGGYDCLHSTQTGSTTIIGNMTVSSGKFIIQSGTFVVQ
jgi:PKD repeat protein